MRPPVFFLASVIASAGCGAGEGTTPNETSSGTPSTPAPAAAPALPPRDAQEWPVDFHIAGSPSFERVVLITIDTLRRDHVSAYGYFRPTTPFFDRSAAGGVLFDNAISPVSHTAPSHASMLTGLPPDEHGVLQNGGKLPANARDLARVFRGAGFETAAFVAAKFLRGGLCSSFDVKGVAQPEGSTVVDAALKWLGEWRTKERFFLWVHLYDPHLWRLEKDLPQEEWQIVRSWGEPEEELLEHWAKLHGLRSAGPDPFEFRWHAGEEEGERYDTKGADEYVSLIDAYDAQILHADRQVERLVKAFDAAELCEKTLFVVTSDHGEGLGSHELAGHGGRIYQEQLRVPLVVFAGDGSIPARHVEEIVQLQDLFPTLAEAAGTEVIGLDPLLHGASLWPLLRGESGWRERPVFSQRRFGPESPEVLFSVQTRRFKYLSEVGVKDEFFRLDQDPLEQSNAVGEPSPERDELRRLLEARIDLRNRRADRGRAETLPEDVLEELKRFGYVGEE